VIQIDFYHDRGDSPVILLSTAMLPAVPAIGHTIYAAHKAEAWTTAAGIPGVPVHNWRVTGVYWQLESQTVSVFVVPCYRQEKPNE
jgi:roadblock/LC7 domain-containing protein